MVWKSPVEEEAQGGEPQRDGRLQERRGELSGCGAVEDQIHANKQE